MNTELKVTSKLNGLAHRLVEANVLDAVQAEDACVQASKKNKSLLSWLIQTDGAPPAQLASAAAYEYGIPLVDIRAFDLSQAPLSLVSEALIEKLDPATFAEGRGRNFAEHHEVCKQHVTEPVQHARQPADQSE